MKVLFTVKLTVNTLLHGYLKIRSTAPCTDTGFEHQTADNDEEFTGQLCVKAGKCSTVFFMSHTGTFAFSFTSNLLV